MRKKNCRQRRFVRVCGALRNGLNREHRVACYRSFMALLIKNEFSPAEKLLAKIASRRSFSFDTVGIIHRDFVTEGTTDNTPMRGRTTGICSEKCVVRRFLRRANVIQ